MPIYLSCTVTFMQTTVTHENKIEPLCHQRLVKEILSTSKKNNVILFCFLILASNVHNQIKIIFLNENFCIFTKKNNLFCHQTSKCL